MVVGVDDGCSVEVRLSETSPVLKLDTCVCCSALVELGKLVFEFREKEGYRRQGFPGPKNLDPPLCDALGKVGTILQL